jgi:hypothetical protein
MKENRKTHGLEAWGEAARGGATGFGGLYHWGDLCSLSEGKELRQQFLGISVVILEHLAFECELFSCSRGHVFERPQSFLGSFI